ncbi:MAG TPA: hypothetical protein VJ990_04240 [Clostridia bacterium]|nr:hypothetical protein [Clostridia bacterium]
MSHLLETVMLFCFGLSWPWSIHKSYKSRTAKGKSIMFIMFIWIGYIAGIANKLMFDRGSYVLIAYIINLLLVTVEIWLYFRNSKYDKEEKEVAGIGKIV